MRQLRFFFVILVMAFLTYRVVRAEGVAEPIGKITAVTQNEVLPIQLLGEKGGKRAACEGCPVFEGDVIELRKKQNMTILFDDGSEVSLGSETKFTVESWTSRDENNHLRRVLGLARGALRAVVNKVYSADEPFIVKSRSGVMGVRGTEFIAAVNNEQISRFENQQSATLYTVSGEVHFARDEAALKSGHYVLARAGYKSSIARGMDKPLTPKRFQMNDLKKTLQKSLPQVQKAVLQTANTFNVKDSRARSVLAPQLDRKSGPRRDGVRGQMVQPGEGDALGRKAPIRNRTEIREHAHDKLSETEAEASRAAKRVDRPNKREGADEFAHPDHHNGPGVPTGKVAERPSSGAERFRPGARNPSRPAMSRRPNMPPAGYRERVQRGGIAPRPPGTPLPPPPPPPGP